MFGDVGGALSRGAPAIANVVSFGNAIT
jgi:hypothetical protein